MTWGELLISHPSTIVPTYGAGGERKGKEQKANLVIRLKATQKNIDRKISKLILSIKCSPVMPDNSALPAGLPLSLFWSILLENVVL